MKKIFLFLLFSILVFTLAAQSPATSLKDDKASFPGKIYGRAVYLSGSTRTVLAFATVNLMRASDSSVVSGTLADRKGEFSISNLPVPGKYLIRLNIIGYENSAVVSCSLMAGAPEFNTGDIVLQEAIQSLKEVTVSGESADMVYKADRRVYNIRQNLNSLGEQLSMRCRIFLL